MNSAERLDHETIFSKLTNGKCKTLTILLGLETLRYFSINKLTASVIYNEHHPPAAGCVSLEGA